MKKIEEGVEKENGLLMKIDALVNDRDANSTKRLTRREPKKGLTGGSEFTPHN